MENNVAVLNIILQHLGINDSDLFEKVKEAIPNVDLEKTLTTLSLTTLNERSRFYWLLQAEVERGITKYAAPDLAGRISEDWNKKQVTTIVEPETVDFFISYLNFHDEETRAAFKLMCHGEMKDILIASRQPILVNSVIRYAACHQQNPIHFIQSCQNLLIQIDKSIPYETIVNEMCKLDFFNEDNQINSAKVKAYRRFVGSQQLAFTESLANFSYRLINRMLYLQSNSEVQISKKVASEEEAGYTKRLEEEVNRLTKSLELEKENSITVVEKTIVQLLNSIAGRQANYLLSDLFEEADGSIPDNRNISQGRLVNLFSALSLEGIEPYSAGYELHEIVTLTKEELIRNFMQDQPIVSGTDHIKVKLIRYGWQYHGKVLIQPLVTEITEVSK